MSDNSSNKDTDRLPTLPQGWVSSRIGETLTIVRGISFPKESKRSTFTEGYIACLRTANVQKEVEWDDLWFIPLQYLKNEDKKVIINDILISTANSSNLVGKVSLVKTIPYSSTLGAFISLLRTPSDLNSKFIFYQMASSEIQENLRSGASTTTNISNISNKIIDKIILKIPPLLEQNRIVTKIEELFTQLDAGVASLKKVQAQLKRYRQAVLKAAFEGRLTQEWREQYNGEIEPADVLLEKYKEDLKKRLNGKVKLPLPLEIHKLPQLPNQWAWTRIGDFVEIIRGASPRPAGSPLYFGGNIPWITVGELTKDENIYLKSVSSYVTEEGKKNSRFIKADTLLLTNSGATLGVPKITLIDGCINDGSVALLGLDNVPKRYLYFFLKSQTKRLRQINQGAAQPNLNTDIVRNIILPLPSLEEQEVIVSEIERYFSLIDHLENTITTSLRQAETLRQSILKRAFEGKLIPQNPNDEPASILLERIKAEKIETCTNMNKKKCVGNPIKRRSKS